MAEPVTARRAAADVLACVLVVAALVVPNNLALFGPATLLRIPVEAVAGVALVLVLPPRGRRIVAAVAGAVLGVLVLFKIADIGFHRAFDRPFSLVFDWSFAGPALSLLGGFARVAAVAGAVLAAVALVLLTTWAAMRLARLAADHRTVSARVVAVLAVVWIAAALTGLPLASRTTAALAYREVRAVASDLADQQEFAAEMATDAFRGTPPERLLTSLRGKDFLLTFVESYGRVALDDPGVTALLDSGSDRLRAAGFSARSAFLTSSTSGGGSWLAHSTMESGLWVDNQQRYRTFVGSDRLTLSGAFARAGWRTVNVQPENGADWPEGAVYRFGRLYDGRNIGYRGPNFSYAAMPDQFTLSAFHRDEMTPGHAPLMAELDLVSSHWPWAPLPRMVDWGAVGDGSTFTHIGPSVDEVWSDPERVRAAYGDAVEYSLSALISYVETFGDDNLVLVFLGDHQPNTSVTGEGASRDVPVTLVARDPAVLDRITGWGWQDGLRPGPDAPVWPMSAFRDRFLTAFGP
ncbi:sulfatase [Amycolatopsis thermoflava]|uniref:sulfatase n=1 Tax=Amycolatopsis thermoflava TaxID=84480 RepID=UPI003EBC871B